MTLKLLAAALTLYQYNFKMLHWNASGYKFDKIHDLSSEYESKISETLDKVVEMSMRVDDVPFSLSECLDNLNNFSEQNFVMIQSENITYETFVTHSLDMFNSILESIAAIFDQKLLSSENGASITDITNIGIKAELESIYAEYDLLARYILKRRQIGTGVSDTHHVHHTETDPTVDDLDLDVNLDL